MTKFEPDPAAAKIIGAAIAVHRFLGPGLLESSYQRCLARELTHRGIPFDREVPVPVEYRGESLDCAYRMDLLVNGDVIVEVKCVEKLLPIHSAQIKTYLRLTGARRGLLMNFNEQTLKAGLKTFWGNGKFVPATADDEPDTTHDRDSAQPPSGS